jgi:PilZ domain
MAGFVLRKSQRLRTFGTMRYFGDGVAGEGIIKDLSLTGSSITGNKPVTIGMVLALHIFVPGEPELLLIERATVKWVKRANFGVDFDIHELKLAERITQVISKLVKTKHGSSGIED